MDTLTKLNVFVLVLSAVLLAMACVRADRVRAWRSGINPSAPEVPDASFTVARVVLVAMAGLGLCTALQGFGVSDDLAWSEGELTSAVRGATSDLDGFTFQVDQSDTPLSFDDYKSLIEDRITENGAADAPQAGITAEPSPTDTPTEANLTITAHGTDKTFCTHVLRTRSKAHDYTPPGISGGVGTLTYAGYRLGVETREGAC
ncbi:hypothetical protein JHN63_24090 [Streptomyces sp. MBT65]|uniref:hypothetical protein n=1 Tax=Streptomyces sp. MBT65 TaxID=1488395 RepID=UPI00190AAA85|nr:hypothetical protein [Streptomyces sp. MBT65]MBK3576831.1 hypothetical protein [Streptomyces sp. MBT65]